MILTSPKGISKAPCPKADAGFNSPIVNENPDRRTFAAVAVALGDAAGRNAKAHIHFGAEHDSVPGPGERRLHLDPSIGFNRRMHEQIDRMDDGMLPAETVIDVVEAVRMPLAVVIEEIVHLRTAAGMQQVVLPHIIRNDPEHGLVEVGIDRISHVQAQGLVAIDGHAGRHKFVRVMGVFRKKIHDLTALNVDDRYALPFDHVNRASLAGIDDVFPHAVFPLHRTRLIPSHAP